MRHDQPKVDRYLRRATRGLWGHKRREVWEELQAHIEERALAHRIGGASEEAATTQALVELGDPAHVRNGMLRIHALPPLLGAAAALAAVCVVALNVTQGSFAQQLSTSFKVPSTRCEQVEATNLMEQPQCTSVRPWVRTADLKEALEPQGVQVRDDGSILTMRFPDGGTVALPYDAAHPIGTNNNLVREEDRIAPGNFEIFQLLHATIQQSELPVTVKGWNDITAHVGDVTFTFNLTPDVPSRIPAWRYSPSASMYASFASEIAGTRLVERLAIPDPHVRYGHFGLYSRDTTFPTDGEPEDVYAVLILLNAQALGLHRAPEPVDVALALDVAQANPDGSVTLDVPLTDLTWVDEWPTQPMPGTAILLRLTVAGSPGEYGHEIVLPPEFRTP